VARGRPLFKLKVAYSAAAFLARSADGCVFSNLGRSFRHHHVGAKTGKARQTPLLYFTDGRNVVLIASKGGARHHPAWLHNIRANPDVELWVGKQGGPYRARVATSEEKAPLWAKANALYAGYDGYQTLAGDREIPVVICSPGN
jgi:deazaflavin-dependent oxidoreductase (nitroreductase family)